MDSSSPAARKTPGLVWAGAAVLLFAVSALRPQGTDLVSRAYPARISPDVSFDAVVSSQPFPPVKCPVPVIGWKEHPEEIHVAPNGALVFPAAALPGGLYLLPRVQVGRPSPLTLLDANTVAQELIDGYLPGVRSEWKLDGVSLRQLAFATLLEAPVMRSGRETLMAVVRWAVKNGSGREEPVRLSFTAGQAASGQSLFKMPPAYPGRLVFKPPFVLLADGRILMRVAAAGASVSFPPGAGAPAPAGNRVSGSELLVDFRIKPGETRVVDLFVPYFPAVVEKTGDMERLAVEPQLEVFRNFWTHELDRGAQFIVPEKRVRDAYRAAIARRAALAATASR